MSSMRRALRASRLDTVRPSVSIPVTTINDLAVAGHESHVTFEDLTVEILSQYFTDFDAKGNPVALSAEDVIALRTHLQNTAATIWHLDPDFSDRTCATWDDWIKTCKGLDEMAKVEWIATQTFGSQEAADTAWAANAPPKVDWKTMSETTSSAGVPLDGSVNESLASLRNQETRGGEWDVKREIPKKRKLCVLANGGIDEGALLEWKPLEFEEDGEKGKLHFPPTYEPVRDICR